MLRMKLTEPEVEPLLMMPDHLRKSLFAVQEKGGEADADAVAEITKRARAVESGYLNQLNLMGWVGKHREGRKAVFTLEDKGWISIMRRITALGPELQRLMAGDILTAIRNRLLTFESLRI